MQEKRQCRRFFMQDYGGLRCIKIRKHILGHVMHVNEQVDHRRGTSCH